MRMRVKKHVCVQKHIPSVKKHPLAWLWVALCVIKDIRQSDKDERRTTIR